MSSDAPTPQPPNAPKGKKSGSLIFAEFTVRNKFPIAVLLLLSTMFFAFPIVNAALIYADMGWKNLPAVKIDTDARHQWPDHPFIRAQNKFANEFGRNCLTSQPRSSFSARRTRIPHR